MAANTEALFLALSPEEIVVKWRPHQPLHIGLIHHEDKAAAANVLERQGCVWVSLLTTSSVDPSSEVWCPDGAALLTSALGPQCPSPPPSNSNLSPFLHRESLSNWRGPLEAKPHCHQGKGRMGVGNLSNTGLQKKRTGVMLEEQRQWRKGSGRQAHTQAGCHSPVSHSNSGHVLSPALPGIPNIWNKARHTNVRVSGHKGKHLNHFVKRELWLGRVL